MPKTRNHNRPRATTSSASPAPASTLLARPDPVPPSRPTLAVTLLALGGLLWLGIHLVRDPDLGPDRGLGPRRWVVLLAAVGFSLVPPVGRRIMVLLDRIRHPSPQTAARLAVAIALLAAGYFVFTAFHQDRDLFAKTHDDQSYLIQMQMLARGRLWMPPHPLADFFDTFYVLVRPKYASLYFPGAALMYVPTIWLRLPTWLLPACVAGAIVGLLYRIVTELVDGAAGLLAALLMASLSWFRVYSILLTSHEPMLLLGLLLFWAWLRWRRSAGRRGGWAVAMGVFAGWGAITRPADAVCFALPVACGVVGDLLRRDGRGANATGSRGTPTEGQSPWRRLALVGAMVLTGAAPFLVLQLVFDKGVTGSFWKTPYALYLERDQPNTSFGFHPYDPAARPQSQLRQKQDYYDVFFAPYVRRHQPGTVGPTWARRYVPLMADTALPGRVLLLFVPVGLLGLADRRRLAFAAVLPLFLGLYVLNTFFLEHYAILVAPAVLLLVLLGGRVLEAAASPRFRPRVAVAFTAGAVALGITTLPELNPLWESAHAVSDETFPSPTLRLLHETLPTLDRRAVILFRYTRPADHVAGWINREPVYNADVAWPDDAWVVRAHDLGPDRNRQIINYYAERQPDRYFYRWDLQTGQLEEMGMARDLAAKAAK